MAPGEVTDAPVQFSVEFEVDGEPASDNPRRIRSRYVLEANRDLRVTRGSSARVQTYPPFNHQLSHADFLAVYRHVIDHELSAEPTSPNAETPRDIVEAVEADVVYHVTLNVNGRWHRDATTPAESPPTVQLLAHLIDATAAKSGPWRPVP